MEHSDAVQTAFNRNVTTASTMLSASSGGSFDGDGLEKSARGCARK
jgi:hypothetical protein